MKRAIHLEHRASSSRSKHEGESSLGLCDRLDRTRDNSQRQLPTDHDYAVPTREYQTDQSSLKPAQAAARSVLGEKQKQPQRQKQPHRLRRVDRVTPCQALSRFQSRTGLKRELAIWHKTRMRPQLLLVSTHPASTLALRAIHSSRSRINGSTDKARCAGIHVASRPSNDMVRTTPANTIGSRGLAS